MARRKKEPRSVHREKIASAASVLFMDKGIVATSMDDIAKAAGYSKATLYPNLPNLLYIGHLTYLWNPYKINVFGLFSFTFICIIDIIIFSDYTYVWRNRRGISGIFEKQKWYYIRV